MGMGKIFGFILGFSLALGQAQAETPAYLFDLPTLYPNAFRLWQQSMPYAIDPPDWLSKLDGTGTPIRDVTIGGQPFKFATVCMPHACGDNVAGVLFTAEQTRIVAVVHMVGSKQTVPIVMAIGHISGQEFGCVEKLLDDDTVAICP
jgi:hypothetical protein